MPKGIQIPLVNPADPDQLNPAADPGSKIIYIDINDGKVKTRDDAGADEILGDDGGDFIHNPVVTVGDSPYAAAFGETVKVNPNSPSGVIIALPDPAGNSGKTVRVVNVTGIENEDAPSGSPDTIAVQPDAGQINGQAEDVMTTEYESRIYESDGNNYIIMG